MSVALPGGASHASQSAGEHRPARPHGPEKYIQRPGLDPFGGRQQQSSAAVFSSLLALVPSGSLLLACRRNALVVVPGLRRMASRLSLSLHALGLVVSFSVQGLLQERIVKGGYGASRLDADPRYVTARDRRAHV